LSVAEASIDSSSKVEEPSEKEDLSFEIELEAVGVIMIGL